MALFAIVGGHGAPGATVTALAMLHAWPLQTGQRVLLAECDPDGGVILAGALEGRLDASRGLGQLGVADRQGQLAQTLMTQLTDVSPSGTADRLLLPGVSDPAQYSGLAYVWESLTNLLVALEGQGVDVLIDLGRSGAVGPSAVLARRADAVLVVARSTLRSLTAAHPGSRPCVPTWTRTAARTRSAWSWSSRARTRPRTSAPGSEHRWSACCRSPRRRPRCCPTAATATTAASSARRCCARRGPSSTRCARRCRAGGRN